VDDYPDGATVGGVEQMVGNVWEWTTSTLDETTPQAVRFPSALRTIRGGAFNTYFENQATCHFQSAEHPLARRSNIGIRLAISMETLAPVAPAED
jgi:iron(II)-dependent oxidoreductase